MTTVGTDTPAAVILKEDRRYSYVSKGFRPNPHSPCGLERDPYPPFSLPTYGLLAAAEDDVG